MVSDNHDPMMNEPSNNNYKYMHDSEEAAIAFKMRVKAKVVVHEKSADLIKALNNKITEVG